MVQGLGVGKGAVTVKVRVQLAMYTEVLAVTPSWPSTKGCPQIVVLGSAHWVLVYVSVVVPLTGSCVAVVCCDAQLEDASDQV